MSRLVSRPQRCRSLRGSLLLDWKTLSHPQRTQISQRENKFALTRMGIGTDTGRQELFSPGVKTDHARQKLFSPSVKTNTARQELFSPGVKTNTARQELFSRGVKTDTARQKLFSRGVKTDTARQKLFSPGVKTDKRCLRVAPHCRECSHASSGLLNPADEPPTACRKGMSSAFPSADDTTE